MNSPSKIDQQFKNESRMREKLASAISPFPTVDNRKVCILFAHGCPRSEIDAAKLCNYFMLNNWQISDDLSEADLVLIGVCGFSDFAEDRSLAFLKIAHKEKKRHAPVIGFGCLAGVSGIQNGKDHNMLLLPQKDLQEIDRIVNAEIKLKDVNDPNIGHLRVKRAFETLTLWGKLRTRYGPLSKHLGKTLIYALLGRGPKALHHSYGISYRIRISEGCLGECSYCSIKNAIGPLKSKPVKAIIDEFEKGREGGHKAFHLIAADVGAYGKDIGTDIVKLLRLLCQGDGEYRIFWDDFSPKWLVSLFNEMYELIEEFPMHFGYMGFPVQSGSERIVKLMQREYSVADAKRCLGELRNGFKQLKLSTHAMVGFPGETEDDFQETIELFEEIKFDHIELYKYSDQAGTPAALFPEKVPEWVKTKRIWRFRKKFFKTSELV